MSWLIFDKKSIEYDDWFENKGKSIYLSELKALKKIVEGKEIKNPAFEIGVGTGRFSLPIGVKYGIEPSFKMAKIAQKKGIQVIKAIGESLPLKDKSVGTVLMIVTLCFLDDIQKSFCEIKRVLKKDGDLIIGFVPRDSEWGKFYLKKKRENHPYYKFAKFYKFSKYLQI